MVEKYQEEELITKLKNKNINDSTIKDIVCYLRIHQKIFKDVIPTDELIERISSNIGGNINYKRLKCADGNFNSLDGKIVIDSRYKTYNEEKKGPY